LQITKRGWNIPSYYNRDSKCTKERSPDLFLKDAKTSKLDWPFQLIENIIGLYKDENQSSQHHYK
jgi:hypothetical protein